MVQLTVKVVPYQIASYQSGDINGDDAIDILDVILLNKFLLGSASLSDVAKASADVDENQVIDATDSLFVLKKVVELIDSLPVGVKT